MATDAALANVARSILLWKQRIAPPGSHRARAARWLTRLLLRRNEADHLRRSFAAWPEPRAKVAIWDGAAPCGRVLADRPAILVLKLDHIGDFIVALPAFQMLRQAFPTASVTLVCGSWNTAFATALGWFDRIVAFDGCDLSPWAAAAADAACLAGFDALDLGPFDLAVDLRYEADTRPLLGRVRATYRAGFQQNAPTVGDCVLDVALPDCQDRVRQAGAEPLHAGARLVALTAAVTATFGPRVPAIARRLAVTQTGQPSSRRYVVIAPGSSAPIKRWPIDRLTELTDKLIERLAVDIVIVGGESDRDDGDRLTQALPPDRVRNLAGGAPLAELPTLLLGAGLFVGYDSGPAHLAASLGVPTVCIFSGVSDASVWQPLGQAVTVVSGRTGCSPCRLTYARDCPNGLACQQVISVETVLRVCEQRLAAGSL